MAYDIEQPPQMTTPGSDALFANAPVGDILSVARMRRRYAIAGSFHRWS